LINTLRRRWLTTGASRRGTRTPVGPAARAPGKVAAPVRAGHTVRSRGVFASMNTNNPEVRRLIEQGVLKLAPLRPRSLADVPRIRAVLNG
jgi:hypothetical protein